MTCHHFTKFNYYNIGNEVKILNYDIIQNNNIMQYIIQNVFSFFSA